MGEQKENKNEGAKKVDGGKKDNGTITVVLKADMHCDGCAKKIIRSAKRFKGVQEVKADTAASKLTVIGKMDPVKLREMLELKAKKKIDLISPLPNKDKEPQVSTVVLKIPCHCEGCVKKIASAISKTKGVQEVITGSQKDLVTVKGVMDVKALQKNLKEELKRTVDIVPPPAKKEEKKESRGGDKKEDKKKSGDGGKKESGGGDKKEDKKKSGRGKKKSGGGGKKEEKKNSGGGGEKSGRFLVKKEKESGGGGSGGSGGGEKKDKSAGNIKGGEKKDRSDGNIEVKVLTGGENKDKSGGKIKVEVQIGKTFVEIYGDV